MPKPAASPSAPSGPATRSRRSAASSNSLQPEIQLKQNDGTGFYVVDRSNPDTWAAYVRDKDPSRNLPKKQGRQYIYGVDAGIKQVRLALAVRGKAALGRMGRPPIHKANPMCLPFTLSGGVLHGELIGVRSKEQDVYLLGVLHCPTEGDASPGVLCRCQGCTGKRKRWILEDWVHHCGNHSNRAPIDTVLLKHFMTVEDFLVLETTPEADMDTSPWKCCECGDVRRDSEKRKSSAGKVSQADALQREGEEAEEDEAGRPGSRALLVCACCRDYKAHSGCLGLP